MVGSACGQYNGAGFVLYANDSITISSANGTTLNTVTYSTAAGFPQGGGADEHFFVGFWQQSRAAGAAQPSMERRLWYSRAPNGSCGSCRSWALAI